ncbi:Polygalacturonase inhibitor 2 [Raphanus sativus]|nr:Polygalacturonase inhibitor 2 [Raphanus sativus]
MTRTPLLKIKKAMNDPYTIISWDPKKDCCTWVAVECGNATINHRITFLDISKDDVSAQIPPEVGDLPYLESLIFHKLPNLTGEIPSSIAKLKYLRNLWLSWTNITGPVPEYLSQLKNYSTLTFPSITSPVRYPVHSLCYLNSRFLTSAGTSLQVNYYSL